MELRRIGGYPDDVKYISELPQRFIQALSLTPISRTPLSYRVGRLDLLVGAWYGTDLDSIAQLWTELLLVVGPDILTVPMPADLDTGYARLSKQVALPVSTLVDSPLAWSIELSSRAVHQFYLQLLGCAVDDIHERFVEVVWELYKYLLYETYHVLHKRSRFSIERQLLHIPKFEL